MPAHATPVRSAWLVWTLATLCAAALACMPRPGGQCDSDLDCTSDLTCQDGLCRPPLPRACLPVCEAGFTCDDGFCALAQAPTVTWLAPTADVLGANGSLAISLLVQTPARDVTVSVLATSDLGGAQPVSVQLVPESDGVFRALFDLSMLDERDWSLTPVVQAARKGWESAPRRVRIDRTGPQIELFLPAPKDASFLRTDTVEVRARLRDPGAGVDPSSVRVVAAGMDDLIGTRLSQTDWSFQVDLSKPTFAAAVGPLALGVQAKDHLGNAAKVMGVVPVTRYLWRHDAGQGAPIRSSAALDPAHLFVGTDNGYLIGMDRKTGSILWSHRLNGPVSASPVRGQALVYAVSEGGTAQAFDPDAGTLQWSCPGLPSGVQFFSSPALANVAGAGTDGAALETLFVAGTAGIDAQGNVLRGGLYALQGTRGFPVAGGDTSCWLYADIGGGRSSPAIDKDGGIYVGDDGKREHKLTLAPDASGLLTFREAWSLPASDDVVASPALDDGGIFFGDSDGLLRWVDPAGNSLSTQPLDLGEKLFASPVIAFGTVLVQGREGTLEPYTRVSSGAAAPPPMTYTAQKIPGVSGVESTPAVGAEGTLYVAAGNALRALSPGGTLLWEALLSGASTTSSPNLGCDGTLYVGDASGTITAIATDSKGLAPGWPRFRHDARGTGNASFTGCE